MENIHSLTDFRRNASNYVEQINETKAPVVLTVNGEAAVVVQDARAFQEMLNRLQQLEDELNYLKLETLRQEIQKGVEQAERGELLDGEEIMARLHSRLQEL
nr:type II toxin-antitoxin system Phd/YefM family antitoxin [Iningainema tapete]